MYRTPCLSCEIIIELGDMSYWENKNLEEKYKMRKKCIKEFNNIYELDSKLKEKQKGKNKDYTPYERLKFNEKANELKQELNNLHNKVSNLEDNKKSISKEITNLNKDKEDITDEIDKKKKT